MSSVELTQASACSDDEFNLKITKPHQPNADINLLHKSILWKDTNNVSDVAYNSCRKELAPQIPKIDDIRAIRKQLNNRLTVRYNQLGVFYSIREKLTLICSGLKSVLDNSDQLNIKFSADGTNIGKKLKLINVVFTCLNHADCKASRGNFLLGVFRVKNENYEDLKVCLRELIEELSVIESVTIGEKTYAVKKCFVADWKCLALLMGLNSASSTYPCIWCKCPQSKFYNNYIEWSISDPNKGARTVEEAQSVRPKTDLNYGYKAEPILNCFNFWDIVPDMLHLFLRITDTLIGLLVADIRKRDPARSDLNMENQPLLKTYVDYLENELNITNSYYKDFKGKKFALRDLSGGEKDKLFRSVDLKRLYPSWPNIDEVSLLWKSFYEVYTLIRECSNVTESDVIRAKSARWLELFVNVYDKSQVTPYMHVFAAHLHDFFRLHGNVNMFNLQGLEKLNDLTTTHYFRSTNKHKRNHAALEQLLKKKTRLEILTYL